MPPKRSSRKRSRSPRKRSRSPRKRSRSPRGAEFRGYPTNFPIDLKNYLDDVRQVLKEGPNYKKYKRGVLDTVQKAFDAISAKPKWYTNLFGGGGPLKALGPLDKNLKDFDLRFASYLDLEQMVKREFGKTIAAKIRNGKMHSFASWGTKNRENRVKFLQNIGTVNHYVLEKTMSATIPGRKLLTIELNISRVTKSIRWVSGMDHWTVEYVTPPPEKFRLYVEKLLEADEFADRRVRHVFLIADAMDELYHIYKGYILETKKNGYCKVVFAVPEEK